MSSRKLNKGFPESQLQLFGDGYDMDLFHKTFCKLEIQLEQIKIC